MIYHKIRNIQIKDIEFVSDCLNDNNLDLTQLELISTWQNKKFAGKIKEIVCILLGCTLQQLEDREFKNTELGEEWKIYHWKLSNKVNHKKLFISKEECENFKVYSGNKKILFSDTFPGLLTIESYILTPRLLMQLLGTECGRDIIHPNIWVNSLMSEYKNNYSNWVISDLRFPNEMKAVKDRGGITIRINRNNEDDSVYDWGNPNTDHESETALDNAEFDYVIDNNGTIEDLVEQVKQILIKENIL